MEIFYLPRRYFQREWISSNHQCIAMFKLMLELFVQYAKYGIKRSCYMYLNCNICKHVLVDKFAAQMSLATALSERRFRYTLLPLLNTLYILKILNISNITWSSSSASHNVIQKSVWLSLSGMNALAGWGCRNNFRKKNPSLHRHFFHFIAFRRCMSYSNFQF